MKSIAVLLVVSAAVMAAACGNGDAEGPDNKQPRGQPTAVATATATALLSESTPAAPDESQMRNEIVRRGLQCLSDRGWLAPRLIFDVQAGYIGDAADIAPEDQAAFAADTAECVQQARAELGLD
jgi:hypothetical protein